MMHSNIIAIAAVAAVLLSVVSAQGLPYVYPEYSTTLEASFSFYGYTLSYDEYSSASANQMASVGRYVDRTQVEYTTFNTQTLYVNDSSTCTAYSISTANVTSFLYAPSVDVIEFLNSSYAFTYTATAILAERNIVTDIYTYAVNIPVTSASPPNLQELVDLNYAYTGLSYNAVINNITFYVRTAARSQTPGQIPIRLQISGTKQPANAASPTYFTDVYDWVNWRPLDTTKISVPPSCSALSPSSNSFRAPFPSTNTVGSRPNIGDAPKALSFPTEFTAVIETDPEAQGQGGGGGQGGQANTNNTNNGNLFNNATLYYNQAVRWTVSTLLNEESTQEYIYQQGVVVNTPTINVYQYGVQYPSGGIVYNITGSPGSYQCSSNSLNRFQTFSQNGGALNGIGGTSTTGNIRTAQGTLDAMFTNAAYDVSIFTYKGPAMVRGVMADWYQTQPILRRRNVVANGAPGNGPYLNWQGQWQTQVQVFNYTTNVYLFPAGWQFPGRNQASDYQLPLLVTNTGVYNRYITRNGTTAPRTPIPYTDIFNIFELLPATPGTFSDDPIGTYGCPLYQAPTLPPSYRLPYVIGEYTATVEQSFSYLGYTLSYDEYNSESRGLLRADARYNSRSTIEITQQLNANGAFTALMNSTDTSSNTCTGYTLDPSQSSSLLYLPSYNILQLLNYSGFQWQKCTVGFCSTTQERNIPSYAYYLQQGFTVDPNDVFCSGGLCSDYWGLPTDSNGQPTGSFGELLDFAYDDYDPNSYNSTVTNAIIFFEAASNQASNLLGAVPLRVLLTGYKSIAGDTTGATKPFYNVFDWVNFTPLSDYTVFTTPLASTSCSAPVSTNPERAPLPSINTLSTVPSPNSPPPLSSFPNEVSMVVETLQSSNGQGGSFTANSTYQNFAVKWNLDNINNYESISYWSGGGPNAGYQRTYIYNENSNYSGGAEVFIIGGPSSATTCQTTDLTSTNRGSQIFYGIGAGSRFRQGGPVLRTLFANTTFDSSAFRYLQRVNIPLRGIWADMYVAPNQVITGSGSNNNGVTWSYTQNYMTYLYLIPQGWQYPGRSSSSDYNLPMLVQNNGYVSWQSSNGNSGSTYFTDSWNIFEIIPESNIATQSDGIAAWFPTRPSQYQCPAYVPSGSGSSTSGGGGGGLSDGSKAALGIMLGLVLPILLCIAAYFFFVRSRKSNVTFSKTAADMPSPVANTQTQTYAKQTDDDEAADESVEINNVSPIASDDA